MPRVAHSHMPSTTAIEVFGARTHNLKNIDCRVPHERVTVVTGLSGSGKSSLAFDTIYAEGQRRFVESISTYARQFLRQMERPPVREIRNVLPAVALEAKNSVRNARSTVATLAEIADVLRLLFTHLGEVRCRTREWSRGRRVRSSGSPCAPEAQGDRSTRRVGSPGLRADLGRRRDSENPLEVAMAREA